MGREPRRAGGLADWQWCRGRILPIDVSEGGRSTRGFGLCASPAHDQTQFGLASRQRYDRPPTFPRPPLSLRYSQLGGDRVGPAHILDSSTRTSSRDDDGTATSPRSPKPVPSLGSGSFRERWGLARGCRVRFGLLLSDPSDQGPGLARASASLRLSLNIAGYVWRRGLDGCSMRPAPYRRRTGWSRSA